MEKLNITISETGFYKLKSLIGQQLISLKHNKFEGENMVFQKVEIVTLNGRYLIDNDVDWFDNYFSGPEDLPFLSFKQLDKNDDSFYNKKGIIEEFISGNEIIQDVFVVQDKGEIFRNDVYYQEMESSEGIVLATNHAQYGFFKENLWRDELLLVYRDEKDVISRIESLKDHWNIFGYPFNAKCSRAIVSLKNGTKKIIEFTEEYGELVYNKMALLC